MTTTSKIIEKSCYFINEYSCYEVVKDSANPLLAAITVIVSVFIAFKQLTKQHQNSISAQREEAKRNTKIELFREINLLLDNVSTLIWEVHTFCITRLHPIPGTPIELSCEEYETLSSRINQGLLSVVSKVESHEIINQKLLKVLRYSLQSIVHDVMQLRFNKDSEAVLKALELLSSDASCYLYDFQICMQNLAYSDVFKVSLPPRVPANKALKVITIDDGELDKLLNYFAYETNWGKNCKKYENEANESILHKEQG